MSEPSVPPLSLSDAEIEEISGLIHALPGRWTVFRHVGSDGDVTLQMAPEAWEAEDAAIVLQPAAGGAKVMLVIDDRITVLGTAPTVWAAVLLAWRTACRRTEGLIPAA